MTTDMNSSPTVRSVELRGLFGHGSPIQAAFDSDLTILYGDNGSGKTTLLNLVYHMLSPHPNNGHRSQVGRIPFKSLKITLSNRAVITASREGASDESYEISVEANGASLEAVWPSEHNVTSRGRVRDDRLDRYSSWLGDLGLAPFYLTEDRTVLNDEIEQVDGPARRRMEIVGDSIYMSESERLRGREPLTPGLLRDRALARSVQRAAAMVQAAVLGASSAGDQNANDIYSGVTERILGAGREPSTRELIEQPRQIVARLSRLETQTTEFARFGLISPLKVDRMRRAINQSEAHANMGLVNDVLRPYLDGIEARVTALEPTYHLVSTLVGHLSRFFNRKSVGYHVQRGLWVTSDNGEQLEFSDLSSGEKHLLLLLTHMVWARDGGSIVLVDEPEISLNVKWQQGLLPAMLDLSSGAHVQTVIATHSVEMIAQHLDHVRQIRSQNP